MRPPRSHQSRLSRLRAVVLVIAGVAAGLTLSTGVASADPSNADWAALRKCESSGRYNINTGNGYYGAYQFNRATWESVGGTGLPSNASPAEQDYRALYLYRMRGWQPWECAGMVGLRNDSSARSKVVPTYADSAYMGGSGTVPVTDPEGGAAPATNGAPAYPGRQFSEGDTSESLKAWQKQMGARGYGLTGTGYFGPKTKAVVLQLQRENGLNVVGFIGPKTWAAAWATSPATPTPAAPTPAAPTPAAPIGGSCQIGASTAPAWPGTLNPGDTSEALKCWQKQMGARGYGLTGTGYYGANTKSVVLGVQQRNGLTQSAILGPKTWVAAWEGQ